MWKVERWAKALTADPVGPLEAPLVAPVPTPFLAPDPPMGVELALRDRQGSNFIYT